MSSRDQPHQDMANLIIPIGIPGSGKSHWAYTFADLKYRIVSSDKIRKRVFGGLRAAHTPEDKVANNAKVFEEFHRDIKESLEHGVDVIADATNLNSFARHKLLKIAEQTHSKVHAVFFMNISQALHRNADRDADAMVPNEVMKAMLDKYGETLIELPNEKYDTVTRIESYS